MGQRHRDVLIAAALAACTTTILMAGGHALAADDVTPPSSSSSVTPPPIGVSASASATSSGSSTAHENPATQSAIFGPVLTPTGAGDNLKDVPHRIAGTDPLFARAKEIEAALKDAATDLGLAIDLTGQVPGDGAKELELVKRASAGVWVVSPRLEQVSSNTYLLRIVAVAPKSSMLLVRFEKVDGARLATRAVVMLRDITTGRAGPPPETPCTDEVVARRDESGRSKGRPVLAVSTSLFGLYAAFSVYRSAGTDDPRLLYPLLALGSGVGLGASLLVSEEFDVTPGISWTLVGGTWWGVIAGSNIAAGRNVQPIDDRYAYGLAGGLIGTTLAVVALASTRYDDGDAALVHSGGAIGTFGGGVIDYLVRGDLKGEGPSTGLGYGAGIGVVAGGLLGGLFTVSAQRVLMIDLGAGLGALAGASAASPLVVVKDASPTKTRWFLGAVLSGTVLGGSIAWVATRDRSAPEAEKKGAARLTPSAGVLGASFDPKTGRTAPIFGAGLSGVF